MVAEQFISAIDEMHLHDGIIADGAADPERPGATVATVGNTGEEDRMSEANQGDGPPVKVRRDGAVATVVLDRPARRNALSLEMLCALHDALDGTFSELQLRRDPHCPACGDGAPVAATGVFTLGAT